MVATTDIQDTTSISGTVAVVLARVVVPLWLFAGAALKLVDLSPTHLPAALIKWCGGLGLDLMFVLRFSIAAELIVVGVMVLLPTLSRWIGIVMLGALMPVLIGDLMLGASSCGCFGAIEVNPWVTLVMDVTFFLGLLLLGRGEPRLALTASLPTSRALAAGVWSLASVVLAFGIGTSVSLPVEGDTTVEGAANSAVPLPADGYYMPSYEEWLGRPFRELEIASWIRDLPEDLDVGQQFVIFYRKDCEHCHELMAVYFTGELPGPTTAVAVPERTGYPTENLQPFECDGCGLAELPSGIDWFIQTPALVRLQDGVVDCVAEVDSAAPQCLDY